MDLKFDTRDKKPHLYDAGLFSLAAVAALAFLLRGGHVLAGTALVIGSGIVLLVLLQRTFIGQLKYNPYSYNTIIYTGFSLFLLSIILTHVYNLVQQLLHPDVWSWRESLFTLIYSARSYMLLSFPFILVFSCALGISNSSLIRHEGRRFVNILGILLSVMMLTGELLLFGADRFVSENLTRLVVHDLVMNLYAAVYLYFECMLIGGMVAEAIAVNYEPEKDKDYLIILGCGIRKDGSPTPLLKGRIDRALSFYRRQLEENGKALTFVTSGGQGPNEVISESACMKRYLMEQGIPETQILEEDQSTSTLENMKFSKERILARGEMGKVAFSTTNYHVFRGGLCARRVKMRAQGMGAKTRWYFWPNASVREFVGLLTEHRGKQLLLFTGLLLSYVILTLLVYYR